MTPAVLVDTETAREFLGEVLARASEAELQGLVRDLEGKHARLVAWRADRAARDESGLVGALRLVFATRRQARALVARLGVERLGAWIDDLLESPAPVGARLETFAGRVGAERPALGWELGAELLHFTAPGSYWLWTRWIWDPATATGALALLSTDLGWLRGRSVAETYLGVGQALALLEATGQGAGFLGPGRFALDVFLAAVYAVYAYTAVGLGLTPEFNRVLPRLPELCRRLLGVYRLETPCVPM